MYGYWIHCERAPNELFDYIDPDHQAMDKIKFTEFAVFMHYWKFFYKFAEKTHPRMLFMNYTQFYDILSDPTFNGQILAELNVIKNPKNETYEKMREKEEEEAPSPSPWLTSGLRDATDIVGAQRYYNNLLRQLSQISTLFAGINAGYDINNFKWLSPNWKIYN